MTATRLQTRKDAIGQTRLANGADGPPASDEVLLKLDRFALTTNNITYAAFGDAMRYWNFFPTGEKGWGHMPVWGFADVVESNVSGIEPGERFYGYFPIVSQMRMKPVRVTDRGFYDGAEHRQELTSAYNQYTRCTADAAWRPEREAHQMLLRPLFITSFVLADFLADNAFFGAEQALFSSASAKTAYGTAFGLEGGIDRIALTSEKNRPFVGGLGCYERTISYEDVERLSKDCPTLYVDFSGDAALRRRIHEHFGKALVYDCYVGSTQNTEFGAKAALLGPKPEFFFAPVQIRKRNSDWGPQEMTRRFNEAQLRFFDHIGKNQRSILSGIPASRRRGA